MLVLWLMSKIFVGCHSACRPDRSSCPRPRVALIVVCSLCLSHFWQSDISHQLMLVKSRRRPARRKLAKRGYCRLELMPMSCMSAPVMRHRNGRLAGVKPQQAKISKSPKLKISVRPKTGLISVTQRQCTAALIGSELKICLWTLRADARAMKMSMSKTFGKSKASVSTSKTFELRAWCSCGTLRNFACHGGAWPVLVSYFHTGHRTLSWRGPTRVIFWSGWYAHCKVLPERTARELRE
mmetsp:Transcript_130721/g.310078  ORF Transcript_130721/g.310078 Transcript_130721/m.310078 type:complete len:239 (+) Transcript_130721:718-1434(+)